MAGRIVKLLRMFGIILFEFSEKYKFMVNLMILINVIYKNILITNLKLN